MAMNGLTYFYPSPTIYATPMEPGKAAAAGQDLMDSMRRELDRTKEPAVTKFTGAEQTPPLWAAISVFTLGTISKIYRLLDDPAIKLRIARGVGYPNTRFAENTFHSLSVLRNITAHYVRIWQRAYIQYAPPVLKRLQIDPDKDIYQRTPWAWLVVLADLVDTIQSDHTYSKRRWALAQAQPQYTDGLKHPATA